jgi:hypothetical protein
MDQTAITLITTALAAGAATGLKDTTSTGIKDAYTGLKALILRQAKSKEKLETTLQDYEQDPDTYEKPLQKILAVEELDKSSQIIEAAQKVLQATPEQFSFQNYGTAQGTIQGNYGTLHQTFGNPPDVK